MSDFPQPFSPDSNIEIKRLQSALDAASVGTWEYDPAHDQFRLCKRFKTIFNYPFAYITSFSQILAHIHPADRPLVNEKVHQILEVHGDEVFDFEFRTLEDDRESPRWINFKGQAHWDETGKASLSGIALNVTKNVLSREQLVTNEERFRSLIEEAPVATCLFVGADMKIEVANDTMVGYWGKDRSIIGKPLKDAVPELQDQPFPGILERVFQTGETYTATNMPAKLEVNGVLSSYYYDFTYKPLRNEKGEIYAVMDTAIDVTEKMRAHQALEESEAKLRSVIAAAPAAMALFVGRDLIIEMPNQAFMNVVGKGQDIAGKPLREVMPELESQMFLQILDDVFTTGKMYQSYGDQVNVVYDGVLKHNFYDITYTPLLGAEGQVYAILNIGIDVTEKIRAQQETEESQLQLLALFEQSPVAIAIVSRKDLTFRMVNPFYAELVGRTPEQLVGGTFFEAIPELLGQGFDKLLEEVVATDAPFVSKELAMHLVRNGIPETIYVNLTLQPQTDQDHTPGNVLMVAIDVTDQVLARQKIQEAEITLRGAVELANLGTFQIDLNTRILDYSERLKEWFGIKDDEVITMERAYVPIREADRSLIKAAIARAITPETEGIYDVEFVVEPKGTGRRRILHALGKTYFNEKGEAVKISGTVQDVTEQRQIQLALEQLVQERTEELESTNEELAAINEEYLATNEELAKSNDLLIRSNENLQQFAYIASHDLQEPLRKIQSFGDLLKNRYANHLGTGNDYLERMQSAAQRMSTLIEDLLAFSRVSTHQELSEPVSLNDLIKAVLSDLELTIQETGAKVSVGDLPVIRGDQLQLRQLYQNLISNALKFREPNTAPVIRITAETMNISDLPPSVKPVSYANTYYRIDVTDDGIGFNEKYTDRIFQIFQRLHGRSEYAGTGIGLAICEKVAANHGGAITATSQPGKGSTFSVYFPR